MFMSLIPPIVRTVLSINTTPASQDRMRSKVKTGSETDTNSQRSLNMNHSGFQINLIFAWGGILVGFLSGMMLGLHFHRENWLGGYTSLKRRMYRLAHISCFALGAVNLFFWLTAKGFPHPPPLFAVASGAFVLGAITMPLCCLVMAHF